MGLKRSYGWIAGTAAWGIAEATFFFIVPDVLLTTAVLKRGWRDALRLAVVAALAATAAGSLMWRWGMVDDPRAQAFLLTIPAVGDDLLVRVAHEMDGWWALHMLIGAITGVPYKLYAVEAGQRGIALAPFLAASFGARLVRFCFSIAVTALAARGLDRWGRPQWKAPLLALGWLAIYAVYFALRAAA
jgi:membrane protein YqaA with SNARE-associated domain